MLGKRQGLGRQAGITGARNGRVIMKNLPGHFGRWNGGLELVGKRTCDCAALIEHAIRCCFTWSDT